MIARSRRRVLVAALTVGSGQGPRLAAASPATGAPTAAAPARSRGGPVAYVFRPGPTAALLVRMDASWSESSRYHDGDLREIRFVRERKDGAPARPRGKLLVTPMATLPSDKLLGDASGGRELVTGQRASTAARAVEKSPPITDAKVGAGRFVSFTVTDAHAEPGEFLRSTQGVPTLGGLASSVTILHDDLATRDEVIAAFANWSAFGTPNVVSEPSRSVLPDVAAACKRGDGLACGLQHEWAGGEPAHNGKAPSGLALLTAGCNAGSAFACGSLGSLYAEGNGVAKNEARARKIFAQGCDAHGWLACVNAGSFVNRGRAEESPPLPESLVFLERACGYGGDHDGVCRVSAGGDQPPARYLAAQKAGCAKNDGPACRNLGWTIETGYAGVTVDVDAARDAYHKACAVHSLWGCFREALFTADVQQQARLYEAACQQGSGPACYALAQPAYRRPPDVHRELVRKACDSSIEVACVDYLGGLAKQPPRDR